MKQIKLIGVAFVAMLMLGSISATAAFAESPELNQKGGAEIKAEEIIGDSVGEPVLEGGTNKVTCKSATTEKVVLLNNKSTTFQIVFIGCKNQAGEACTSKEKAAGEILTAELLLTLWKNKAGEFKAYFRNANKTLTGELTTFTCGEKTVKVTGCVSAANKLNGESNMLEGTTEAKTVEIEEGKEGKEKSKCKLEAFGTQSFEKASLAISYFTLAEKEGKKEKVLLSLELK
jgi:hypothetical protein